MVILRAALLHWKHLDKEFWERTFLLQKGVEGYLILWWSSRHGPWVGGI